MTNGTKVSLIRTIRLFEAFVIGQGQSHRSFVKISWRHPRVTGIAPRFNVPKIMPGARKVKRFCLGLIGPNSGSVYEYSTMSSGGSAFRLIHSGLPYLPLVADAYRELCSRRCKKRLTLKTASVIFNRPQNPYSLHRVSKTIKLNTTNTHIPISL